MQQLGVHLFQDELTTLDQRLTIGASRVFVPFRWPRADFPRFERLCDIPVEKFAWWFPHESPPFRTHFTPLGDFCLDHGAEVLEVSLPTNKEDPCPYAHFEWDDMTEVEPDHWEPASAAFMGHIRALMETLRELCVYHEQVYTSRKLLAKLLEEPDPPKWMLKYRKRPAAKAVGGAEEAGRVRQKTYAQSLEELQDAIGLDGHPKTRVSRRPRYDDEKAGPSLFRTSVAEQQFLKLTLPGLYIGRSEVSVVSFAGSKLYRSTFNWNDFIHCDFSACDLHDSDLRACEFKECSFKGANLSQCDLRCSGFESCDFVGAKLDAAALHYDQRGEIDLSEEQFAVIAWTADLEVPEGG